MTENNVVIDEAEIVPADDVVVIDNTIDEAEADDLNKKIRKKLKTMAKSFYELGTDLKRMKDGELYIALGYKNFVDYVENGLEIPRTTAYRFVGIAEKLPKDIFPSWEKVGICKLELVSTLPAEIIPDFVSENDVEHIKLKDLKSKVKAVKSAPIVDPAQTTFDDVSDNDETESSYTDDDMTDLSDNDYDDTDSDSFDEDDTDFDGDNDIADNNKTVIKTVSVIITDGDTEITLNYKMDLNDVAFKIKSIMSD